MWLLVATALLAPSTPAALQTAPPADSVKALLAHATERSLQHDTRGALDSLERARDLAPNSEEVLSALAEALMAADEPLRAIAVLDGLTRICPSIGSYQYLLGAALLRSGDAAAAVLPLQEAARLEPDDPPVLIALGSALNRRNLYDDARTHLLHALSLAPDSVEAAAELAVAEEGRGESLPAEAHATRVLAREPGNAAAHLVIGMLRMKEARYEDARDALLLSLEADSGCAKAHYQLSLAYGRLGDGEGAARELELYHHSVAEADARVEAVRAVTGFSMGGMQR